MRVLFLVNIPSPYRVNFFNELGKLCDLTVLYETNSATDRDKTWMSEKQKYFTSIFLKGIKTGADNAICPSVLKWLDKRKFDIFVVGGYSTPTGMLAVEYLHLKKIPFFLNSDGGFIKNDTVFKQAIKKHFISKATAWLSTGKKTNEYLMHYGAKKEKIYIYPFTSLKKEDILVRPIIKEEKEILKKKLNIKEEKIIVSVGQFINRKGFDVLLKSCENIPEDCGVYIIGGQPTQEYIDIKSELKLNNIYFIQFKSKEELKKYYMASDLFVLPTREDIWGLVVNEAMSMGLPVITTDRCVAGLELVENYNNGFLVPVNDIDMLAQKMNEILSDDKLRNKMGENNLDKIQQYTIENMAKANYNCFLYFLESKDQL